MHLTEFFRRTPAPGRRARGARGWSPTRRSRSPSVRPPPQSPAWPALFETTLPFSLMKAKSTSATCVSDWGRVVPWVRSSCRSRACRRSPWCRARRSTASSRAAACSPGKWSTSCGRPWEGTDWQVRVSGQYALRCVSNPITSSYISFNPIID